MTDDPFTPPPPPPPPERPQLEPIPWEDRARLGFARALVENVKLFVLSPQEGFQRMKPEGDYASPILFAVIVGWLCSAVAYLWSLLFSSSMFLLPGGMDREMGGAMAMQGAFMVGILIVMPLLICIGLFLMAGIFHLCLMLVKGTEQSPAGFEGTLRVVAYSSVSNLGQLVPFVGGFIALIWGVILYILGLSATHRTTQGKAALAVLIPFVLCCLCIVLAIMVGMGSLLAAFGGAQGSG